MSGLWVLVLAAVASDGQLDPKKTYPAFQIGATGTATIEPGPVVRAVA